MKLTSLLAIVACIASLSCASNQSPTQSPPVAEKKFTSEFNPLEGPGERPLTVAETHAKNVAAITGNPARALR